MLFHLLYCLFVYCSNESERVYEGLTIQLVNWLNILFADLMVGLCQIGYGATCDLPIGLLVLFSSF